MKKERFEKLIGRNVRDARLAAGFTQEQLAEKVDISASFLSRVENGNNMPSVATIGVLADKLGISPERLLAIGTEDAGDSESDNRLNDLISQSTDKEKRHLCKYIALLRELRTDE